MNTAKKLLCLLLAMLLTALTAGCAAQTKTEWQQQYNQGMRYLDEQDYTSAIGAFITAIRTDPDRPETYMMAAVCHTAIGDITTARALLDTGYTATGDEKLNIVLEQLPEVLKNIVPAATLSAMADALTAQPADDSALPDSDSALPDSDSAANSGHDNAADNNTDAENAETPSPTTQLPVLNNDLLRCHIVGPGGYEPNIHFDRSTLTQISFLDTLAAAPADAWDFSKAADGSVLAWLDDTHLYIAGNGGVAADADASYLFGMQWSVPDNRHLTALQAINFNQCFDTSGVTNMSGMFFGCQLVTGLDVSGFDTSHVTDMSWMFDYCTGLVTLDLHSWDISHVTTMYAMFCDCSALTTLDVSSWDISHVANTDYLFTRTVFEDAPPLG